MLTLAALFNLCFVGQGSILGSFSLAIFGWLIGALGHDAGHFAASRRPWINHLGLWGMSLLSNPILWQHQHTYAHHSHTNSFDHDPDLHHFHSLLRVHRRFKQQSIYKNQTNGLFVMFAYCFVVFGTCIWIPLGVLQEGTLYGLVEWTDRRRPFRAVGMLLHLLAYAVFIFVVPFWAHSSGLRALVASILHVATSGLIFALFSQINHLNHASLHTGTRIPDESMASAKRYRFEQSTSWAAAQVETSNNFCPQSLVWHVLSNGLNYQIEHHLFPGINHCHLHHISPVVEATCHEFGVHYKSFESWSDIMQETLLWLTQLAEDGTLEGDQVDH